MQFSSIIFKSAAAVALLGASTIATPDTAHEDRDLSPDLPLFHQNRGNLTQGATCTKTNDQCGDGLICGGVSCSDGEPNGDDINLTVPLLEGATEPEIPTYTCEVVTGAEYTSCG